MEDCDVSGQLKYLGNHTIEQMMEMRGDLMRVKERNEVGTYKGEKKFIV